MNIKNVLVMGIVVTVAFALSSTAYAILTVSNVSAKQRYPWNGLIDVTYTVSGEAGSVARPSIMMTAIDENAGLTYLASTFETAPTTTVGTHTATWNPIADGLHIVSDKMRMSVSIEDGFPLYCLINVKGGASATSYPVTYLDAVPSGGWTTTHKTDYIVMRWCPAGTYMMQGDRKVTLTNPFYISIFETTQGQYKNVMGSSTKYSNSVGSDHPCGARYRDVRGSANWPSNMVTEATSFVGKLMSKSGLSGIDLPTEAQWEYACRAGSPFELYTGKALTPTNLVEVAVVYAGSLIDEVVGSKKPNAWGLYDMLGNASEMCLDWYQSYLGTSPVLDPKGPSSSDLSEPGRVSRGVGYGYRSSKYGSDGRIPRGMALYTTCARGSVRPSVDSERDGFRICMTLR